MKKCIICDSEFNPKNSLQKTCSVLCRKKHLSKQKTLSKSKKRLEEWSNFDKKKKCLVCNEDFELHIQHRTQKYCSKSCRQKAERIFGNKQKTDLEYKDKIRFGGNKYKVLERDSYKCTMCENKSQLVIHHIDNSGQSKNVNNDIDNLTTLCRRCHINIHKLIK